MMKQINFKRGGISMFIVVIAGSLVTLVTASFIRIVTRDQMGASNLDLSQSAYDSAQTGVEDAKRFMITWSTRCKNGLDLTTHQRECSQMATALATDSCTVLSSAGIGSATGETQIQTENESGSSGNDLNQAYTCVKIRKDTPDFLGGLAEGNSRTIPLKSSQSFNKVRISWHTRKNMKDPNGTISLLSPSGENFSLPSAAEWNGTTTATNRPAILKAQFYGYRSGRNLEDLDGNFSTTGTGLDEQLYYPVRIGVNSHSLPLSRRSGNSSSTHNFSGVRCADSTISQEYACRTEVSLGHTVQPADIAFLRLSALYTDADFKVELMNNDRVVHFDGVQPIVDSTGRANDKFRRVESRIEFEDSNFPVPDFAVQTQGSEGICKDFWVTNETNSFEHGSSQKNCNL
ncbi:hypothetical protein [Streptococcus suis]|uniref:hypothetical protein n=1 Tax=Streptococcus suis TaxID=1307 RepID=UPI001ABDC65F|nr:hypothetical protein [Streptococcus suis]